MTLSSLKHILPVTLMAAAVSVLAFGVSGCGSGGTNRELANQPAPQTLNGLVLTLDSTSVILTFLRAEGDAVNGVETGSVTMNDSPHFYLGFDSANAPFALIPSSSISGGRYTYVRTSAEAGVITITGEASGFYPHADLGIPPPPPNYFATSGFMRQYDILFGTDGAVITGMTVNDSGEGLAYPGVSWTNPSIQKYGGGSVTIGWSLEDSMGLNLPKIYPASLSHQRLEITPDDVLQSPVNYEFLDSTFTRFSEAAGDFLEEGIGNKDIPPDPTLVLINFDYQPDPNTAHLAKIRIYEGGKSVVTYDMTFLDLEKGTYVREDGSTGTFWFPFLN